MGASGKNVCFVTNLRGSYITTMRNISTATFSRDKKLIIYSSSVLKQSLQNKIIKLCYCTLLAYLIFLLPYEYVLSKKKQHAVA
jgi:hypothetical protein